MFFVSRKEACPAILNGIYIFRNIFFTFDCKISVFLSFSQSPFWSFFVPAIISLCLEPTQFNPYQSKLLESLFMSLFYYTFAAVFEQIQTKNADNWLSSGKRGCRIPLLSDEQYSCPLCIYVCVQ